MNNRVPTSAAILGAAGLLPPLAGAVVALKDMGGFGSTAAGFILVYSALIFSFLGGSWWAFASREERPSWWLLLLAVLPSLAAWALLPMRASELQPGLILSALILLSPLADAVLHERRLTPPWWMRLRVPLSVGLALLLALTVWWGR
jgi:Protein of unknown function (DUF3429)